MITREQIEAEPWLYTPSLWKSLHGVHQPWIAEISPMQVGLMSKRQRERYEKERTAVWQTSIDSGWEWRTKVLEALEDGKWNIKTPGLSEESERLYWHSKVEAEKKAKEDAFKALAAQNKVQSVKVGDIVHNFTSYCRVVKILPKKVKIESLNPGHPWSYNVDLRGLQWLHYSELKRQAEAGLTEIKQYEP